MTDPRPTLRKGDYGPFVEQLQQRLITLGYKLEPWGAGGGFDNVTKQRVRELQMDHHLVVDGIVGPKTWLALDAAEASEPRGAPFLARGASSAEEPKRPPFTPLVGNEARAAVFGHFRYEPAPTPYDPEAIRFLDDWPSKHIVTMHIPQLVRIPGIVHEGKVLAHGPRSGNVACHKLVAGQLTALWQAWDDANLLEHVMTWNGLWAPRFVRGSTRTLSNHAYGSAFDINAPWNPLGGKPAPRGTRGSVLDLVDLATEHGFWWGGWFSRTDGMHFEWAKSRS